MELTLKWKGYLMASGCKNLLSSFKRESVREFRPWPKTVGSSAIISSLTSHISCFASAIDYFRNVLKNILPKITETASSAFCKFLWPVLKFQNDCFFNSCLCLQLLWHRIKVDAAGWEKKNRRCLMGKPLRTHGGFSLIRRAVGPENPSTLWFSRRT